MSTEEPSIEERLKEIVIKQTEIWGPSTRNE
jgi:hypothetical protein